MHALVINRLPLSATPYAKFLGPGWDVTILDAGSDSEPRPHETVVSIDDFPTTPEVETLAASIHAHTPIDRVITMSEHDVLRGARMREQLGIEGQGVDSALAFRDKVRMKAEFSASGIPHAECSAIESIWDLLNHGERVGYPVVVKPRLGAGSVGVEILHSTSDVEEFARRHPELNADPPCDLMAERYVENTMMHVDGVWADGNFAMVCASTHGESTTLDFNVGKPLISVMLDPDDPLHVDCVELVRRMLQEMPTPSPTIFHVELFREGNKLLINEVGCRMGGGKIHRSLRTVYDMSMTELYLGLLGGRFQRGDTPLPRRGSAGWILIPPRAGTIISLPEERDHVGLEELQVTARAGDQLEQAALSTDNMMSAVLVGDNELHVRARIEEVRQWFVGGTVIDPIDPVTKVTS